MWNFFYSRRVMILVTIRVNRIRVGLLIRKIMREYSELLDMGNGNLFLHYDVGLLSGGQVL